MRRPLREGGGGEHAEGGHLEMRLLGEIASRVRLLGRATPVNFAEEVARVTAVWEAGRVEAPRFVYGAAVDLGADRRRLAAISDAGGAHRWGVVWALCAARARELGVEAAACEAAGTEAFWGLCRERYRRRDGCDEEADRVAEVWAAGAGEDARGGVGAAGAEGERVASDDERDPRSLVCAMRRAVGAHRLPFRVQVSRTLAALAATGDAVIFVAAGRRPSAIDVARTVAHEVLGHAAPGAAARRSGLPLLSVGTEFGSDDQEGRALLLEERGGFATAARRRELGLRHLAARAVEARADFVDTARMLMRRGAGAGEAVRISARAHRGGGLGREVVYLPAMLRVRAALSEEPGLDRVLGSGRVSVGAARALSGLTGE